MLRTAQSLPLQGLLTLGFDAGRFPPTPPACYRASWQLPGPDSHRQATTSFTTTDHLFTMTSHLLVARKIEASEVQPQSAPLLIARMIGARVSATRIVPAKSIERDRSGPRDSATVTAVI